MVTCARRGVHVQVTKRLRQPLVHILEHRQMLGDRQFRQVVEPCDGIVHPRVARGRPRARHHRPPQGSRPASALGTARTLGAASTLGAVRTAAAIP